MFRVGAGYRGIGRNKSQARLAMRNDHVQQGRDGDDRARGREPEAAQGLQVFDRPHRSLRRYRAPKPVAPPAPPEQGARRKRFRDNQSGRSLFLTNNTYGGRLIMSRHKIPEAQRRDRRMLSYGAALLAPAAALLVALPRLAANLFATVFGEQTFMPHGMCYLWVPALATTCL